MVNLAKLQPGSRGVLGEAGIPASRRDGRGTSLNE
jgi:hypothetical protein